MPQVSNDLAVVDHMTKLKVTLLELKTIGSRLTSL